MEGEFNHELRLAALCRQLGDLWFEDYEANIDDEVPEEKLKDCKLMLIGKLYLMSNVNFQAFQSTMKEA